jgi:hypothetical protein
MRILVVCFVKFRQFFFQASVFTDASRITEVLGHGLDYGGFLSPDTLPLHSDYHHQCQKSENRGRRQTV